MKTKKLLIILSIIAVFALFNSASPTNYEVTEQPIELEQWMLEPFELFVEEPLQLENWMMKPFNN